MEMANKAANVMPIRFKGSKTALKKNYYKWNKVNKMLPQANGKSPYLVQTEIIKAYATKDKIFNISVFGIKQKSCIHICDAVQGIESLTCASEDVVENC